MDNSSGGESTLVLTGVTASTSRHWKLQDDSILQANVTQDLGLPCLSAVGTSIWGVGLAGCPFLCVGKYIALLICLLGMSGVAPSIRIMRALNLRGSCS